jgi:hypothetical protein
LTAAADVDLHMMGDAREEELCERSKSTTSQLERVCA